MNQCLSIFSLLVSAVILLPSARAQTTESCPDLVGLKIPGMRVEITGAKSVGAGAVPSHCRIDGVIESRTGVDNASYGIGFALALPDDWNGRFLFQGGGGLNGIVQTPLGALASGDASALARGFAVVSTDSGHKGKGAFDGSFLVDQEATLNFLYQAIGKVTVVAKRIIASYYEHPPNYSYFAGCSTGGREAMIMAQRYPRYFDGIISGAPAMRTGFSNLGMRWVSVALNRAAKRDGEGKSVPGSAFSDGDKKLIVDSFLNACDGLDGVKDGIVFDTGGCNFDPASLQCRESKTDQCLTADQVNAVKTAMSGARDSKGNQVYVGYLYDTGIGAGGTGGIPGLLNGNSSPVDPPSPPTEQDVDAEALQAETDPLAMGDTKEWTNLSTFSGNGGKLLFYHGVSDPWFSALDTVEYYKNLGPANGGAEKVRQWSRLFLVPGMGHCGGGAAALDQFDMLSALVDWVENKKAPDFIVSTGKAFPGRSRPLCPYPKHAHYAGSGDPEKAENFECQ